MSECQTTQTVLVDKEVSFFLSFFLSFFQVDPPSFSHSTTALATFTGRERMHGSMLVESFEGDGRCWQLSDITKPTRQFSAPPSFLSPVLPRFPCWWSKSDIPCFASPQFVRQLRCSVGLRLQGGIKPWKIGCIKLAT